MELFRLLGIVPGVTAVIGSGGKSTLLRVLSRELPGRVLLCTSTHFLGYPEYPVILNPTEASLRRAFAAHPVVCAARQTENGKLRDCGLPYDLLASLADFVVVEADGSIHDPYRVEYFRQHISEMGKAIDEGVEMWGYTTWAPIDLISASTNQMSKRYGFIYVDKDNQGNGTLQRRKKDSFEYYKKVIASNGQDLELPAED